MPSKTKAKKNNKKSVKKNAKATEIRLLTHFQNELAQFQGCYLFVITMNVSTKPESCRVPLLPAKGNAAPVLELLLELANSKSKAQMLAKTCFREAKRGQKTKQLGTEYQRNSSLAPVKSEIVEIVEEVNGNHEIAPPDTENSSFEELEVSITFFFYRHRSTSIYFANSQQCMCVEMRNLI